MTVEAAVAADDNRHRRRYALCGLRAYAVAVLRDNRPYTIRELLGDID
jgi:hypothetical protein